MAFGGLPRFFRTFGISLTRLCIARGHLTWWRRFIPGNIHATQLTGNCPADILPSAMESAPSIPTSIERSVRGQRCDIRENSARQEINRSNKSKSQRQPTEKVQLLKAKLANSPLNPRLTARVFEWSSAVYHAFSGPLESASQGYALPAGT